MNERITALIIQTVGKEGVIASRAFGHWALTDDDLEKFAELLLREAAEFVDLADENKCESIGDVLLTYFGVEA